MKKMLIVFVVMFAMLSCYANAVKSYYGNDGRIYVHGMGVPGNGPNKVQNIVVARTAAIVDAQRKLISVVQGITIDSETTVRDSMLESDVITRKIKGELQGAQVVQEGLNELGAMEVVMALDVSDIAKHVFKQTYPNVAENIKFFRDYRKDPGMTTPSYLEKSVSQPAKPVGVPQATTTYNAPVQVSQPVANSPQQFIKLPEYKTIVVPEGQYSSLVIDARGLKNKLGNKIERAMAPKIFTPDKKVVYGVGNIGSDFLMDHGLVEYITNMDQLKNSKRAGNNPLIIKGQALLGRHPCDVVITPSDAELIKSAVASNDFLKEYRVLIIKD